MRNINDIIAPLAIQAGDCGCDLCFKHLQVLAQAQAPSLRALAASEAHLRSCVACREDADSLRVLVRLDPVVAGNE